MQLTPSALAATFLGFNTMFQAALQSVQPLATQLATQVPSSGEANVYAFMTKLPRMRQWIGERQFQNLSSKSYQLNNLTYELSFKVDREKIEDDQLGIYSPMISEYGRQVGLWMDDQLVAALQSGAATTTYDGVSFFSTSHPVDSDGVISGTQSNLLTAADLTATTFEAALVAMQNYKGNDNRPLGVNPTHLVVPPALARKARDIVKADRLASGATNTLQGLAEILVLPQLQSEASTWYLMDLSRSIKPLLMQVRRAPEFAQRTQPDSDAVFLRNEYEFGASVRGAAGYGLWFLASRNNPTGT